MKFYLDGSDWEADYFLTQKEFENWTANWWDTRNLYLDSAGSSGFSDPDGGCRASYRCTIPGTDRSVLLENGEIGDPYFGRNLDRSRWSEQYSWAFRKTFRLPEEARNRRRFQLRCLGIDYRCRVFLNGADLGEITGMFLAHEFDVTEYIRRDGENFIAFVFDPIPQANPNHVSLIDHRPAEFTKFHRSQMSWGWDWCRGMGCAGIWDHLYLNCNDDARITDCFFLAAADGTVSLDVETIAQRTAEFELNVTLAPVKFDGPTLKRSETLALSHGPNRSHLRFAYPAPELWYPNGYGKQPLYTLELELDGEITTRTVAFRTLEMRRNPDSPDGAYNHTFTFNGVEIFARGANWVPADLLHERCGAKEYDRLVRLAAEAGVNIFRVWGGGIVEKEAFYDACDRYGIIVWQEFMHSCSNYPKDAEYVAFKRREGEAILRKIRNHVSVSMICGGNEMLYYGEIPDSPVYRQYAELVERLAPHLPYHTSSPNLSIPGERHHGPWSFMEHGEMNRHHRQFVSEIGCNGFCEYGSLVKFIPEADLETPESQSWKYHFAPPCRVYDWKIPMAFFAPRNTRDRCLASMFAQSDVLGYWMAHCRRKFPRTTGCIIWQYNEPWPTLAWSVIDYYTVPKMAYYRLMRMQKPAILSLKDDGWRCPEGRFHAELFLTCDAPLNAVSAEFRLSTADGTALYRQRFDMETCERGTRSLAVVESLLPPEPPGGVVLARMRLTRGEETLFEDTRLYGAPDFKQLFTAPPPRIEAAAETPCRGGDRPLTIRLRNTGEYAALLLKLSLPDIPERDAFWMENYIVLAGGEERRILVKLADGAPAAARLKLSAGNLPETEIPLPSPR